MGEPAEDFVQVTSPPPITYSAHTEPFSRPTHRAPAVVISNTSIGGVASCGVNAICSLMNRRAAAGSPCRKPRRQGFEERVLWRIARFPDEVVAVGRTQTARTRVRFGDRLEGRDGLQGDHEHAEGEVRARNDNGRQRRARRPPGPQILVGDDAVAEVAVVEGGQGVCQGARRGDAIGDDVRSKVAARLTGTPASTRATRTLIAGSRAAEPGRGVRRLPFRVRRCERQVRVVASGALLDALAVHGRSIPEDPSRGGSSR